MPLLYVAAVLVIVAAVAWLVNNYFRLPSDLMRILNLVLALLVVGIVLWLINTYVPMAGSINAILNIVVVVATCVRVLQVLGLWSKAVETWGSLKKRATMTRASDAP
jgi:predicted membrane protein